MQNKLTKTLRGLISPEKLKIYTYTITNIVVMFLAFITSVLLTRWLLPEVYGQYKYAVNILLSVPTYYEFGIHFCTSRIVAEDNSEEKHPVVAISIVIISVLSALTTLIIYLVAIIIRSLSTTNESLYGVAIVLPFLIVFAIKNIVGQLYQGTGKIYRLSLYSLAQYLLIMFAILVGKYFFLILTFEYCIGVFIVSNAIIQLPVLFRMRLRRYDIRKTLTRLINDIKGFGVKLYLSSFAATGASSLISLICGAAYGYTEYAYYTLALSLAQFFTLISSSVSVVKFKSNVQDRVIHSKDIFFMVGINTSIYIVFSLLINTVFFWVYTPEYAPSIFYLRLLAIAYIFNGMSMYYNRFFIARKEGNTVLISSIRVAIVNVLSSVILIPALQITGMVIASLISATFNFAQYIFSYFRYKKKMIGEHEYNQ